MDALPDLMSEIAHKIRRRLARQRFSFHNASSAVSRSRRPYVLVNQLIRIAVLSLAPLAPVMADDPDNCLLCHQYRGLSRFDEATGRAHLFFVDPEYSAGYRGPHARLACTD